MFGFIVEQATKVHTFADSLENWVPVGYMRRTPYSINMPVRIKRLEYSFKPKWLSNDIFSAIVD